jgi:hypothetical protein
VEEEGGEGGGRGGEEEGGGEEEEGEEEGCFLPLITLFILAIHQDLPFFGIILWEEEELSLELKE